jgi:hypothetical protein
VCRALLWECGNDDSDTTAPAEGLIGSTRVAAAVSAAFSFYPLQLLRIMQESMDATLRLTVLYIAANLTLPHATGPASVHKPSGRTCRRAGATTSAPASDNLAASPRC